MKHEKIMEDGGSLMRGRWLQRVVAVCGLLVSLLVLVAASARPTPGGTGSGNTGRRSSSTRRPKGADVKEALTDFPVLVRLHSGNFTFENAKSDGSDIRFVASDDKTPLKYHIERYDPKEEMVLIWVKVPQIAPPRTRTSSGSTTATALPQPARTPGAPSIRPSSPSITSGKRKASPRMPPPTRTTRKEFTGKLGTPPPSAGASP